jgi:uncharacterized protein YbgA (DUF1722 family)/uncharacterized protein YbbK (DUF523 family)
MRLGVSSCLLGNHCRYDGLGSKYDFITDQLSEYFELVPYCPEVEVFGAPRETIRLISSDGEIDAINNKSKESVKDKLSDISNTIVDDIAKESLCGFILKSKSPTCGMERVKVYDSDTNYSEKSGVGIFAQKLMQRYPYLPVEEEGRLNDAWLRENFLMQVICYSDLYDFLGSVSTYKELVDYHTTYKYLIYAKSQDAYKSLGNIVANHEKRELSDVLSLYEVEFLKAISIKSSINKTYNVLLHIFGYFKKHMSKDEKAYLLETLEEFKAKVIPLIAVIKILKIYIDRFDIEYLKRQKFLQPYPKQMALRSRVEALK